MSEQPIPAEISANAKAVADWFVWNHTGETLVGANEALVVDLAQVLTEFRSAQAPAPSRLGLTPLQSKGLAFIADYQQRHRTSPSFADIGKGLGLKGRGSVHMLVHQLIDRGAVTMAARRARSISIVRSA